MRGKKVLVCGVFDFLHAGHLDFFSQAKAFGKKLVVLIARDSNVAKAKGRKPFFSERERAQMVGALSIVDEVVLGDARDFVRGVLKAKTGVLILGYDQRKSALPMLGLKASASAREIKGFFKMKGLKLKVIVLKKGFKPRLFKSSKIRARLGL